MTLLDIAQSMRSRLRDGYSAREAGVTVDGGAVEYGTAKGDSADGFVTVLMDGAPEDSPQYRFEVPVDAPVSDNDRVAYISENGHGKAVALESLTVMAENADTAASEAQAVAEAVNQHFWDDTNGAHVTEVEQGKWTDSTDPAYHTGRDITLNSNGILLREDYTPLASFTPSAVAFYDGQGDQPENVTASFGTSGAIIGRLLNGESRAEVSTDGLHVYQRVNGADESIADLGYGLCYNSQGTLVYGPFYTIGHRATGSAVGVDSVAEGAGTTASGTQSHAEGAGTVASGVNSHAEGQETTASGNGSHAEGDGTTASGTASHAQNTGTIAASTNQTAMGRWNVSDAVGNYALIVGNGYNDNNRSNALIVSWNGDIAASGEVVDGNGNKLSDPCDLSTATGTLPIASGGSGDDGTKTHITVADIITPASGITISAAYFARWGKVAMLTLTFKRSSAIAQGGNITIGTVKEGFRPIYAATAGGTRFGGWLTGSGNFTATNFGAQIAANTTVYISATYLLP